MAHQRRYTRCFGDIEFHSKGKGVWISSNSKYKIEHVNPNKVTERWEVHCIGDSQIMQLIGYGFTMEEATKKLLDLVWAHQFDDETSSIAGVNYNVSLAYRILESGLVDAKTHALPVDDMVEVHNLSLAKKNYFTNTGSPDQISMIPVDFSRAQSMPKCCLELPCLVANLPIGIDSGLTPYLLDGRHRVVKAYFEGRESIKIYFLTDTDFIQKIIRN